MVSLHQGKFYSIIERSRLRFAWRGWPIDSPLVPTTCVECLKFFFSFMASLKRISLMKVMFSLPFDVPVYFFWRWNVLFSKELCLLAEFLWVYLTFRLLNLLNDYLCFIYFKHFLSFIYLIMNKLHWILKLNFIFRIITSTF